MLSTQQRLDAIKKVGNDKDVLDAIVQRIQLNPDHLSVTIDNIPIERSVPGLSDQLRPMVLEALNKLRDGMLKQAEELMATKSNIE